MSTFERRESRSSLESRRPSGQSPPTAPRIRTLGRGCQRSRSRNSSAGRRGPHNSREDDRNRERCRDTGRYRQRDGQLTPGRERSRSPDFRRTFEQRAPLTRYESPVSILKDVPQEWNSYRPIYPQRDSPPPRALGCSSVAQNLTLAASSSKQLFVPDWTKKDHQLGHSEQDRDLEPSKDTNLVQGDTISMKKDAAIQSLQQSCADSDKAQVPSKAKVSKVRFHPTEPSTSPPVPTLQIQASNMELDLPPTGIISTEITDGLEQIFESLSEEAATLSTLKAQEKIAKQKLDKRTTEFEKTRPHHEKFPAIAETQGFAKKEAQKAVDSLKIKIGDQEILVKNAAKQAANLSMSTLITHMQQISSRDKFRNAEDKQRLDKLELGCQGFKELLERQQEVIAELQKNKQETRKELERVEQTQKSTTTLYETELEKLRGQVNTTIKENERMGSIISELSKESLQVQRSAVELTRQFSRISDELTGEAGKIVTLSNRTGDLGGIRESIKNLTDTMIKTTKTCADLASEQQTLVRKVVELEPLQDRLSVVELRPDNYPSVDNRLTKIENSVARTTSFIVTEGLDAPNNYNDISSHVEGPPFLPSPKPTLKPFSTEFDRGTTLISRLQSVEQIVEPLSRKLQVLEDKVMFTSQKADFETIKTLHANQLQLDDLENRIGKSASGDGTEAATNTMTIEAKLDLISEKSKQDASETLLMCDKLDSRLAKIEAVVTSLTSRSATQESGVGALNFSDTLIPLGVEDKIKTVNDEIEVMRNQQLVLQDCIGEIINTELGAFAKGFSLQYNQRLESIQGQLSLLATKAETEDLQANIKNTTHTTTNLACDLNSKLLGIEQRWKSAVNDSDKKIGALEHAIANMMSRMDNLDTTALGQHILGQLVELYPNVQNTETSLASFRKSLVSLSEKVTHYGINANASQNFRIYVETLARKLEKAEATATRGHQLSNTNKQAIDEIKARIDRGNDVFAGTISGLENSTTQSEGIKGHVKPVEAPRQALSNAPAPVPAAMADDGTAVSAPPQPFHKAATPPYVTKPSKRFASSKSSSRQSSTSSTGINHPLSQQARQDPDDSNVLKRKLTSNGTNREITNSFGLSSPDHPRKSQKLTHMNNSENPIYKDPSDDILQLQTYGDDE